MPASTTEKAFRYPRVIGAFFCLLTLILLTGCPYESREPLSVPADAKIDGRLLGRWKYEDKESKEVGFLAISRFSDTELLIVVEENGKKVPDMMRGFVTAVEGRNFLNLQEIKGSYGDRKWIFVSYEAGDCSLTFRAVNDSLAPAGGDRGSLTSRQVFELIRKNLPNKNIYDEPTSLTCIGR
jgi:hypothetical protein